MTRVLFLHTTSEIGGSDVSLVRLVERLDRSAFSSVVVLPSDGPLVARLRDAGAKVVILPAQLKLTSRRGRAFLVRFALNYPRAVAALVGVIRRERADLVHTNTIHNLYGFAAARLARVPHVWHVREIVWQSAGLRRIELFCARRWSSRVIATSEAVAAMFGPPDARPRNVEIVPNGVEVERFASGCGARVRDAIGVGGGDPLVGLVCRLDVWKGVEVFLHAAARVAAVNARARFVVVGGALIGLEEYAASLPRLAASLGIADRVRFTDWRFGPADMPDVHAALDLLVLASTEPEPFGLVLLEAMAAGKPVVATAHGGPLDIVVDGVTGDLVPPSDAAAMSAAMLRLIDDPSRARALGAAGRARVAERYTAERYVGRIEQVYQSVCAASPAS